MLCCSRRQSGSFLFCAAGCSFTNEAGVRSEPLQSLGVTGSARTHHQVPSWGTAEGQWKRERHRMSPLYRPKDDLGQYGELVTALGRRSPDIWPPCRTPPNPQRSQFWSPPFHEGCDNCPPEWAAGESTGHLGESELQINDEALLGTNVSPVGGFCASAPAVTLCQVPA